MADYNSGLAIIDISDPTNPGTPIYKTTSGNAYEVYIEEDFAYVAILGSSNFNYSSRFRIFFIIDDNNGSILI